MLIYEPKEFARLINLRFFYASMGNEDMKVQVDRDIDEMISQRIASAIPDMAI